MADKKTTLPRRSRRFDVGKEIGGAVYMHRDYEAVLGSRIAVAKAGLPLTFAYTVVKYSWLTEAVTFVESPDFDTSPEPSVGASVIVRADGSSTLRRPLDDPYIYHHKWLFVRDDYRGFNVGESVERSRSWLRLSGIDRSRIGRQSYWRSATASLGESDVAAGHPKTELVKLFGPLCNLTAEA